MAEPRGGRDIANHPGTLAAIAAVKAKRLPSPIRERPQQGHRRRKLRRRPAGVSVVPGAPSPGEEAAAAASQKRPAEDDPKARWTYRRLTQARRQRLGDAGAAEAAAEEECEAFVKVPEGVAENFWMSPSCAKPFPPALRQLARAGVPQGTEPVASVGLEDVDMLAWHDWMKDGFTLSLQGFGSKFELLEAFADRVLDKWAQTFRIRGFTANFPMAEMLRDVYQKLFPNVNRSGSYNSVEGLVASIRSAHRRQQPQTRKCFVVHNLECLSVAHQTALSTLAATPGIYFVVSTDSVWAPLWQSSLIQRNFRFVREEVHTFVDYEMEHKACFPGDWDATVDPNAAKDGARKVCVGVVLKTLTRGHRELVQAIAEEQLEGSGRGGVSLAKLMDITTDRMIAVTMQRLRALLTELKDHELVTEFRAPDGAVQLALKCSEKVLQRLADGQVPDESEDEDSDHDVE